MRNEARSVADCLDSVLSQDYPADRMEVLIADGMSNDGTRAILQTYYGRDDRLQRIDNPRGIVSTGLNAAIRAARGDVIVRMDAHTESAPDYVRQCVEVLHETGADNVGGPWVARGRGYLSRAIAAAFQSPFAVGTTRGHNACYEGPVDTVYLGCWPRAVFDRVGFFDEDLVRNQDDEFNLRLTRAGGKVWQSPRIRSWYQPRASLGGLFRQYMQYGYWKVRVIRKHRLPASWLHVVPAIFLLALVALAAAAPFWQPAMWGWLGLVGAYMAGVVGASSRTARRGSRSILPVLPFVFGCFHFGYSVGFLLGLGALPRRGRAISPAFTTVTRPSAPQTEPLATTHGS
jgi:glycosyltransferase involved in cell wall biosynthesis